MAWAPDGALSDPDLHARSLARTRARLATRGGLHWIVGGSCTGKSAVTEAISARTGIRVYDMDAHMYGAYLDRYDPARHPACTSWFKRPDGLRWVLSQSWDTFDALNRAVDAEVLDLFSIDLVERYDDEPLLVDGGISHPAQLAAVLAPARVVCLSVEDALSRHVWSTDEARAGMRDAVRALTPDGRAWETFLAFNDRMSATMVREATEAGIAVVPRRPGRPVSDLAAAVARKLGLGMDGAPRT